MKDLLLVGGGHSHVAVLKYFAMHPAPGVRVTLVSRGFDTPYSGMLPGFIAGHYTYDDAHIDLQRLARFSGARPYFDEVVGFDPVARRVHCATRPPVSYDILSINIGSTPNASVPGAAEHAIPVKPIDRFLQHWAALCDRVLDDDRPRTIAVVGGGAGGVELLLSVQYRLRTMLQAQHRPSTRLTYQLFTSTPVILPTHSAGARVRFERILRDRGVRVHTGAEIVEVAPRELRTRSGERHHADEILWTTEARAASWIPASGLATDDLGFVKVSAALQSVSHPEVFAAGDVAAMVGRRLEKSGVYAVREGKVLGPNLRRALTGEPLQPYKPQRQFLSLISTGDRYAVASRGPFSFAGAWVWRWKDSIDRRFMRRYQELPAMDHRLKPDMTLRRGSVQVQPDADGMRCGGCGAKVGATVLARALARLQPASRPDVIVGLGAPDDAAVVDVPACKAMVHTVDFFRAMVDDAYVFGRIAANHALGDLYAMGAEPQTALAIVTIPYGPESKVEDTLTELLAGATAVLRDAGAALVGGHTSEGAELGLGFTVNGLVDRERILRKGGLRPGDRLVLTKPIGTGTMFAADMRHAAKGAWVDAALRAMTQSSRDAAACLLRHHASACTDVTGFGVAGHLLEMAAASDVAIELDVNAVPVLPGAEETVSAGFLSTLQPQNTTARRAMAVSPDLARTSRFALLFDSQTAGGLLAGVAEADVEACLSDLRAAGYEQAAVIGRVLPAAGSVQRISCIG